MLNSKVESDSLIHQLVMVGDIDRVSQYLADGGSPNILDKYDCEPLYIAVKYGRLEIAEMLLAAGGNIFRHSKFRGNAFGAACWNWNARMMEFCVRAGVDVNELYRGSTILDSMESQKRCLADPDYLLRWQATHDKLVALGARHATGL